MSTKIVTPVTALTRALYAHGYSPRPTGHGVLWPANADRMAELASALRKRSLWALAAACEAFSDGLSLAHEAMRLPPGEGRMPGLTAADACYQRTIRLAGGAK
jgi:hypothetical protein